MRRAHSYKRVSPLAKQQPRLDIERISELQIEALDEFDFTDLKNNAYRVKEAIC